MGGGQVVGMDMRFQNPLDRKLVVSNELDNRISGLGSSPPRTRVEIEHRIDDHGGRIIGHSGNVGDCISRLVKE